MVEETLSDKIKATLGDFEQLSTTTDAEWIMTKDVKAFIKKIKDDLCSELLNCRTEDRTGCDRIPQGFILSRIDKWAGEKLTKW